MNRLRRLRPTWLLVALLATSACDCEAKLRKLADRQAGPRVQPASPDADVSKPPPASSEPVEQEPNDSPAQATRVELTNELRPVRGELTSPRDVDWFEFVGPPGETPIIVELVVEPLSNDTTLDLSLELLATSEPPVRMTYQVAGVGQPEVVPLAALGARDPLMLAVRAASGQGSYRIRFVRSLSSSAREAEPNDIEALAWPLAVPGQLQGMLDRPHDRDVFALSGASQEQLYTLRLDGPVPEGVTLELTRPGDSSAYWLTLVGDAGLFEIPNLALPSGPLFLTLSGGERYDRARGYRLHWIALPEAPKGVMREAEPNDTIERAQPILGEQRLHGWLHHVGDVDHFELVLAPRSVEPAAAEVVKEPPAGPDVLDGIEAMLGRDQAVKPLPERLVTLELTPTRPELALELVWRIGAEEQIVLSGKPGESLTICRAALVAGSYKMSVRALTGGRAASGPAHDYVLKISDVVPKRGLGELEPNDTMAQADRLALGVAQEGTISTPSDRDVWALDVYSPDGGEETAQVMRFTLAEHPLRLSMQVQDDEGGQVLTATPEGPNMALMREMELVPGRYFVEIRSEEPRGVCAPYRLGVTKVE